eukprot:jgi/Undpi1/2506/HiC_scaffold_13.g05885.m1
MMSEYEDERTNSKWVFKRKGDGSFKARVVAQGWNQVPGLDSGGIYAPVCMIQSVRIICCIAVHFGLLLHQTDVSTALLYAVIQELVFVEQPSGFEVKDKDGVGATRSDCHVDHGGGAGRVGFGDGGSSVLLEYAELGFGKGFAKVPLYCDNKATLHALGNRSFSSRTKHIALRFFFIRELVSEGRISIHYIPTDINPADIGTKHVNKHRFRNLLNIISNFNVRSPTGLERLARLLAATKEDASAEISKLDSQVQALRVERATLEAALESSRDQLADANSLVDQLRLENTRKWREEERNDWRALLDSTQEDRTALQQQNTRLETELKRCIGTLLSAFPPPSPAIVGAGREGMGAEKEAFSASVPGDDHRDPPELTHRVVSEDTSDGGGGGDGDGSGGGGGAGGGGRRRGGKRGGGGGVLEVDREWLTSLAEEFDVVAISSGEGEGIGDGEGGEGEEEEEGDDDADGLQGMKVFGEDAETECARLRLELAALRREAEASRSAVEVQVRHQQLQLRHLGKDPVSSRSPSPPATGASTKKEGGSSRGGVFGWWRRDQNSGADDVKEGKGVGAAAGGVTIV